MSTMELKTLILRRIAKRGQIKTAEITKISGFSRAYVGRIMKKLQDKGIIMLVGKANKAIYIKADKKMLERQKGTFLIMRKKLLNKNLSEDLILEDIRKKTGIFLNLPENVIHIISYAFTEILNNAIEHSKSELIEIFMERADGKINFNITDRGIGIFENIQQKKNLADELEAIQDLLKGKETTAPEKHSGEGIFFTSKIADIMTIKSFRKSLIFNNLLDDVFIDDAKEFSGTKVSFSIAEDSRKNLKDVFDQFTDESYEFSKTKVRVSLFKKEAEYVSRSQVRRILFGLEKFSTVILDFKNVQTVGQAFADEIFRVWRKKYPQIEIIPKNANENVIFMIRRALI